MSVDKHTEYFPHSNSIALFVDADNFPMKKTSQGISSLLQTLQAWGNVTVRKAYSNSFTYKKALCQSLLEHQFQLVEVPLIGRKNSVDIYITMEVIELIHTLRGIQVIALASGDSDFTSLVKRLRQHRFGVIGIGSNKASARTLIHQCDTFLFYEDMLTADLNGQSQPLKTGAEAMKTILRKRNVYPPAPTMRREILTVLSQAAERIKLPCSFKTIQDLWIQESLRLGVSRRMVRNTINALIKSDLLVARKDGPLKERLVTNIPNVQEMASAICLYQVKCLLNEADLIADPVTISQVIWGTPKYTEKVTRLVTDLKACLQKESNNEISPADSTDQQPAKRI